MKKKVQPLFLFLIIIALLAGTIYLAVIIQDQNKPTGSVNTRASEPTNDLLAYKSTTTTGTPTTAAIAAVTPSVIVNTIYPTSGGVSPTAGASATVIPSIKPSPTIVVLTTTTKGGLTEAPPTTPPDQLPTAGFETQITMMIVAASSLIFVAFLF